MTVFSFLDACIVLPDTSAECFSLLFVIPRNPRYGTAHFVAQFQRIYFGAVFASLHCQHCSAKIIKLAFVFWLKWIWGMLYIVSFHTDHLLPKVVLIGSCSFLEKKCELAVTWPEEGDRDTTVLLTRDGDFPLGWGGVFIIINKFTVYLRLNCILSLSTAQHPYLIYKTYLTAEGGLLLKHPALLAFGVLHTLDFGHPNHFSFCSRAQEQLAKGISCSAAITLLKWPLNFTALLSAKPSRSSTLRFLMSMFLVCVSFTTFLLVCAKKSSI